MRLTSLFLLLLASGSQQLFAANIIGSDESERLYGSDGTDYFYGGEGADTFIINHLSTEPDEIIDFDPAEGDMIKLELPMMKKMDFNAGAFRVNRKGLVTMRLLDSNDEIAIVNTKKSDLKLEVNQRKGAVFLKFTMRPRK